MMKLTTKKIEEGFMSHPLKSQDGQGFDAKVIVKYFKRMGMGLRFAVRTAESAAAFRYGYRA